MVNVNITKYGFIINGHANYDEYGYDIVCSAISALTQTIAISLRKYCNAKINKTTTGIIVEMDNINNDSILMLNILIIGLKEIQNQYPKHLNIRIQKGLVQ